jgi:hypothetical protein
MSLTPEQMREEFVNTMLRTKSKATRDSIIATGLLPISFGIDILAGPIGGLGEINTVWAYASIRGAKTARSVTKRLASSAPTTSPPQQPPPPQQEQPHLAPPQPTSTALPHNPADLTVHTVPDLDKASLTLTFLPSSRLELLRQSLNAECNKVDPRLFPTYKSPPLDSDVLAAIGWSPHQSGGETRNWEDEQWEMTEVKEDLKLVMHKGAKEWRAWCRDFEKNPEKNIVK